MATIPLDRLEEESDVDRMVEMAEGPDHIIDMGYVKRRRLPDGGTFILYVWPNGGSRLFVFPPSMGQPGYYIRG